MNWKLIKTIPPRIREMGIFLGWIVGLILIGSLAWFLTQPVRSSVMMNSVNKALARSGALVRLDKPIAPWGMPGRAMQAGTWFTTIGEGNRGVVFSMMTGGITASMLGVLSPEGAVKSIIPLSANAVQILETLPQGSLGIYIHRLETGNALLAGRTAP